MFDLFDDRANITKRQLIYASTCFPDEISSFSENKAKEVAAEKFFGTPGKWKYDDLRNTLRELYSGGDVSQIESAVRKLPGKGEGSAKLSIIKSVVKCLPPNTWTSINQGSNTIEISDQYEIRNVFDIHLKHKTEIIHLFVSPHSDVRLKRVQEDRLLQLLSYIPFCPKNEFISLISVPVISNHRTGKQRLTKSGYFSEVDDTKSMIVHFRKIIDDLSQKP